MKAAWQEHHRQRPRRPFLIWSLRLLLFLIVLSWLAGDFQLTGWFTTGRLENLSRFAGEVRPWPLQNQAWNWGIFWNWAARLWQESGGRALAATLALSVAAISGAGLLGALASLAAARNLASPDPFESGDASRNRTGAYFWDSLVQVTRAGLVYIRSVPEYVWAFLFLALLGPTAWPLVLALALHNTGIMGKLGAEVIENTDPAVPTALRAQGAGRLQIALSCLFPLTLPRYLLYFFYRWETCVREATVLGMLGISSLGFLMVEARARNHYDELLFFILLGALLVLAGDLVSAGVRRLIRNA